MRYLSTTEIYAVTGGNEGTAPTCTTQTDSNGDSYTWCTCEEGSSLQTTTEGGQVTMTCVPDKK